MAGLECSINVKLLLYFRVCGLIVNQEDMPFTDLVGTLIKNSFLAVVSAFYLIRLQLFIFISHKLGHLSRHCEYQFLLILQIFPFVSIITK